MRILSAFFLVFSYLVSFSSLSAWQLDNKESSLTFVSIKKGTIAENHSFKSIAGDMDDSGKVNISIDLKSIDSKIEIRDARMTEFLFETAKFSLAKFSSQLNHAEIAGIAVGSSKRLSVKGNIDLHGQQQGILIDVLVARLSENNMVVTTLQPTIIKAEDFALVQGINKLKALANLPSIAYTVPVSFVLTFKK